VGIVCDAEGGADADLEMNISEITFPGASTVSALNDLNDVNTTGLATGQLLSYNGSIWVPGNASSIAWEQPAVDSSSDGQAMMTTEGGSEILIRTQHEAPSWVRAVSIDNTFATQGVKAYCTSTGVGGDANKPWYDCSQDGGIGTWKTKTNSLNVRHVNLTPNEAWAASIDLITGGDTDPNALGIAMLQSGGSQTGGDEGGNGIRVATNGSYGSASGTATVPQTTGDAVPVTLSGVSAFESELIGTGKLLVLTGSARSLTRTGTTQPPGTYLAPGSSFVTGGYGPHTGTTYNWDVTSAFPAQTVIAKNWCVADTANDYYAPGSGELVHYWLKVSDVSTTQFATEWHSQSADQRYPFGLAWSGNYVFAPCYTITGVTTQDGFGQTTGVTVYKTDGAANTVESTDFAVVAYGEFKSTGVKLIQQTRVPTTIDGFSATIALQPRSSSVSYGGLYHGRYAFAAEYSGSCMTADMGTSCLPYNRYGAWDAAMYVPDGGAINGIDYGFINHHQGSGNTVIKLDPPTTESNWGYPTGGNYLNLVRVDGYGAYDIRLNGQRGWGVGSGEYFPLITAATTTSHTDGQFLTWSDSDGAYIETAPGLDDLTGVDLTTTAPTNGDVLAFDGTNWVPGAGGGGGANTSFSNFPVIGTSEAALFNGSSTITSWNGSYTALAFAGASFTATLPEITSISDLHKRVEIWVQPGVTLTIQGHANDATALAFNVVTTGAGTASMTFTAPASDIACKVEVFVRGDNAVITSGTCPTQTLSNPN
jgi:hypothetical protein